MFIFFVDFLLAFDPFLSQFLISVLLFGNASLTTCKGIFCTNEKFVSYAAVWIHKLFLSLSLAFDKFLALRANKDFQAHSLIEFLITKNFSSFFFVLL